jgi:hypothetical protein
MQKVVLIVKNKGKCVAPVPNNILHAFQIVLKNYYTLCCINTCVLLNRVILILYVILAHYYVLRIFQIHIHKSIC